MFIVSGCPRSGTSLMMLILGKALGEDRIIGKKFPQEKRILSMMSARQDEDLVDYENRLALFELSQPEWRKDLEESKDMNPNGFWECPFTVGGCYYTYRLKTVLDQILVDKKEKKPPKICKIVSQGLINSDPRYLTKIVYMVRHPRAVAKSQERLKRNATIPKFIQDTLPEDWDKEHTPQMYIQVTGMASRFCMLYPDIDIHLVNYEDLIEKPKETLLKVQEFLGEDGKWEEASEVINPKLRRSYPKDVKHTLWGDSEKVFDLFNNKDYSGVVKYLSQPNIATNKENQQRSCIRMGRSVTNMECTQCKTNPIVTNNYKKLAVMKEINWENMPCVLDCENKISVKDSITNNHWITKQDNENTKT